MTLLLDFQKNLFNAEILSYITFMLNEMKYIILLDILSDSGSLSFLFRYLERHIYLKLHSNVHSITLQVLRSTDLLIRHPETRLPTLPGVRERRVLEFILAYTKALDSFTEDDIDTLMLCVKWKFIDIFDEKECVDYVAHVNIYCQVLAPLGELYNGVIGGWGGGM